MTSMEVKTFTILEIKVNLSKTKVSTIFGGPLGDKRECLRVSVKTNKHSHRSHWIFSCFSFLKWLELEVFRFFEGRETEKDRIFSSRKAAKRKKQEKVYGRGIPFPF